MTGPKIEHALLLLPGVQDAEVRTVKAGVALAIVTGGDRAQCVMLVRNAVAFGVAAIVQHRDGIDGAYTEVMP